MSKITQALNLLKQAIEEDKNLREKYQIGDKFRFIRDSLQQLLAEHEQNTPKISADHNQSTEDVKEDELLVYVYLYNTQGMNLKSWEVMLLPKVFYEYSVNRPIYTDKNQIETLIKNKSNKLQHGYLCIAVKKADVITSDNADPNGPTLIRVREGSLNFNRFISFSHQQQEYKLNDLGELVKK